MSDQPQNEYEMQEGLIHNGSFVHYFCLLREPKNITKTNSRIVFTPDDWFNCTSISSSNNSSSDSSSDSGSRISRDLIFSTSLDQRMSYFELNFFLQGSTDLILLLAGVFRLMEVCGVFNLSFSQCTRI